MGVGCQAYDTSKMDIYKTPPSTPFLKDLTSTPPDAPKKETPFREPDNFGNNAAAKKLCFGGDITQGAVVTAFLGA